MIGENILDVLIVGGGPTGSALAIDLTRRGLDVRLIERRSHAFDGSRAKGVQPRSLEVFADLGVLDEILDGGSLYPKLGIHIGPFTVPWRMFSNKQPSDDVPYPNTWLIPQFRIDRILHACLERQGRRVEFGTELIELAEGPDVVHCKVSTEAGIQQIAARYVVGADGGGSTVRQKLGLEFIGTTDESDRILIVDAAVSGLARDRWHMWPGAAGRFVGACPLPHSDLFQFMVRLSPGEAPPQDNDSIIALLESRLGNPRVRLHSIRWQSVFRPNIRLAERYRRGRVFVAGDAAHVHPPAGAQGLNTGIQDAYNLGWKIAQVLAGANPTLLDTYEAERQPIASGVLGLSTKKYEGIGRLDPSSIRRGKDEQQLLLTYQGGPLAPSNAEQTKTLRPGDRAPDAQLRDAQGAPLRLFDIYRGHHFTAVAYGRHAAEDCRTLLWPSAGAPLRRVFVEVGDLHKDTAFTDPSQSFKRHYGVTGDTLILVRPDGYIAHIATRDIATTTMAASQAMIPPHSRSPELCPEAIRGKEASR
ncbi:FAD-dependent oxidoreductase [Burkholderia cepacia]|uniref:FAD-dependent oxidoreductase n=1 Tax=Burkholderia cepacia TaxID=292 RepID=UPI0019581B24|nr:FAD-dependent oxidoreductase [Burkholderia cepacia]